MRAGMMLLNIYILENFLSRMAGKSQAVFENIFILKSVSKQQHTSINFKLTCFPFSIAHKHKKM
jgi:hypothetical protein